jgi:hypothetical protein
MTTRDILISSGVDNFLQDAENTMIFEKPKYEDLGFTKEICKKISLKVMNAIISYDEDTAVKNSINIIVTIGLDNNINLKNIFVFIFSYIPSMFSIANYGIWIALLKSKLKSLMDKQVPDDEQKKKTNQPVASGKKGDTNKHVKKVDVPHQEPQEPAVAAKSMEFNIENFVTHQDPPKQVSAEQLITKKPIVVEAPKPRKQIVGNPILDESIEEKVKYLKTRMKFLDGVHKNVGVEELNALINLLDSPMFKQRIKELNCKSNISSVFLREVPMDKYGNSERITKMKGLNFNYCFEIPTKDKKDPIVVFLGSNDGWVKFNMTIYLSSKLKDSNK